MGTLLIYWRAVMRDRFANWAQDMRQVPTEGEWAAFHRQLKKHRG